MKNVTLWGRGQQILFPLRSSFLCQTTGFSWIDIQLTQTLRAESMGDKHRKGFPQWEILSCGLALWASLGSVHFLPQRRAEEPDPSAGDTQFLKGNNVSWSYGISSPLLGLVGPTWENTRMLQKRRALVPYPSVLWKQDFKDKHYVHSSSCLLGTTMYLLTSPSQIMPKMWTQVWPLGSLSKTQLKVTWKTFTPWPKSSELFFLVRRNFSLTSQIKHKYSSGLRWLLRISNPSFRTNNELIVPLLNK